MHVMKTCKLCKFLQNKRPQSCKGPDGTRGVRHPWPNGPPISPRDSMGGFQEPRVSDTPGPRSPTKDSKRAPRNPQGTPKNRGCQTLLAQGTPSPAARRVKRTLQCTLRCAINCTLQCTLQARPTMRQRALLCAIQCTR
jgi:hypothetical protein